MSYSSWLDVVATEHRVFSRPGSGIVDVMAPVVDDDGRITLVQAGKHDLYAEIQSHADSVDIHKIIQRFKNGDVSALNRRAASYMDVTDMPQNYAELLNTVIETRQYFDALDPEIRAKFDDDFGTFVESFGSEDFIKAFGVLKEQPIEDIKSEVIESE